MSILSDANGALAYALYPHEVKIYQLFLIQIGCCNIFKNVREKRRDVFP